MYGVAIGGHNRRGPGRGGTLWVCALGRKPWAARKGCRTRERRFGSRPGKMSRIVRSNTDAPPNPGLNCPRNRLAPATLLP